MTVTLDLTPEQEVQLAAAARQEGLAPAELVKKYVTEHLPVYTPIEKEDPTLALFAKWEKEDVQMTPEEIAEENRRWEELKTHINAERDRAGARRVF